jgi:succinate dehydrogenase / fumarate reductase membrane anchor subunit
MNDQRTPLARVLGSGSAKDGTGHWWAQRLTSLGLLLLGLWFLAGLAQLADFSYADVREWLARPTSAVLLLLLVVSMAWHSDLGIQVVVEDYVQHPFLKVTSLIVVKFLHVFLAAASIFAILRIAFR